MKEMSFKKKKILEDRGLDPRKYTIIKIGSDFIKIKEDKTGIIQDFRY